MSQDVIVIGAGFAGLAAAGRLAQDGFRVKVFEKNSIPGGRARKHEKDGFLFDLGPSWYWLPDVYESYFKQFGKSASDYYDLVRLDPSYRVFYSKNELADIPAGKSNVIKLFESIEKGAGEKLGKFLEEASYKYEVGVNNLVYKPARSILEYADWNVLRGFFRLHILSSIHKYVRKNFSDPRLLPILEFPVIFLGGTPKRTPAMYNLMNYADIVLGTWYPMGGMYRVIEGMKDLAESLGAEFVFNAPVQQIKVNDKRATGVVVNDEFYSADIIVATADYHHVEQELLAPPFRYYNEKYWDSREMAPSSIIYYLGIDKKINGLKHNNLFFDEDFEAHTSDIFENPRWPEHPLMYVSATSKTDPSVAPEGMENLMVLIPVAAGLEDTPEIREKYFNLMVEKMERVLGEPIAGHIVYKRSYAHKDFISDYNAYKGNAYGLGNTLMQTAILKPKMHSPKVKNLLYAGQLTTPGPGVPPSIISGQVAAAEAVKYANKKK